MAFEAQSIHTYQRITKAMGKLADGVEADLKRMDEMDLQARQAAASMEELNPRIERLRAELADLGFLSAGLRESWDAASAASGQNRERALDLQRLLLNLTKMSLDSSAVMAATQERSLSLVARKTDDQIGALNDKMATAVRAVEALQYQIVRAALLPVERRPAILTGCRIRRAVRPPSWQPVRQPWSLGWTGSST